MKLSKILLFFFVSLPISLGLRFLQLNFTIDTTTGFYLTEAATSGKLILLAIFVCLIASGVFGSFTYHQIVTPPRTNLPLSVASLLLAAATISEVFISPVSITVPAWQTLLLQISGIACGIYFFCFALCGILNFKLPAAVSTIPTIYLIARTVFDFMAVSKLSFISDHIIVIFSYCAVMFFMLNFSKLYNGIDLEKNTKKLLSFGLPAIILCFTNSIPNIVLYFTTNNQYNHTSMLCNISLLAFGIFISTFLFSALLQNQKEN